MPPIKSGETITTTEPKLEIIPTREVPLPVGTHTFEVEVEDSSGNKASARVQVTVRRTLPEAVLKGPDRVEPNARFTLDASDSSAVPPARLVRFNWRLVPPPRPTDPIGPINPIPIGPLNPNQ